MSGKGRSYSLACGDRGEGFLDLGTHYLMSLIQFKYTLLEQEFGAIRRVRTPRIYRDLREIRKFLAKTKYPMPDKIWETFLEVQKKRNALVHGELVSGPLISTLHVPNSSKTYCGGAVLYL